MSEPPSTPEKFAGLVEDLRRDVELPFNEQPTFAAVDFLHTVESLLREYNALAEKLRDARFALDRVYKDGQTGREFVEDMARRRREAEARVEELQRAIEIYGEQRDQARRRAEELELQFDHTVYEMEDAIRRSRAVVQRAREAGDPALSPAQEAIWDARRDIVLAALDADEEGLTGEIAAAARRQRIALRARSRELNDSLIVLGGATDPAPETVTSHVQPEERWDEIADVTLARAEERRAKNLTVQYRIVLTGEEQQEVIELGQVPPSIAYQIAQERQTPDLTATVEFRVLGDWTSTRE